MNFLRENLRGVPFDASMAEPSMFAHDLLTRALYFYHRYFANPDIVYIHGGGHFNDIWGIGADALRIADEYFDSRIMIGPASCNFADTDPICLFQSIESEVTFFCREMYSNEIMADIAEDVDNLEICTANDTALHLTPEDFDIRHTGSEYTLVALRTDKESALTSQTIDFGTGKWPVVEEDVSIEASTIREFVSRIANANEIYTDRLHVALTASIFDVPTTLYGNSYHKNKGVYEFSLSDHPKINFANIGDGVCQVQSA